MQTGPTDRPSGLPPKNPSPSHRCAPRGPTAIGLRTLLAWKAMLNFEQTVALIVAWYRDFQCDYGVVELGDQPIFNASNRFP
jgi:hypothetical protein